MATVPSPRTWLSGETPTATMLDANLRDAYGFFMNPPRVKAYNTTGQSISTTTDTLLTWGAEIYDSDGMHSTVTNTSRLTAVTAGFYEVCLHINWEVYNNSGPGNRYVAIKKNGAGNSDLDTDLAPMIGSDTSNIAVSNSYPQTNHIATNLFLNAGDYLEAAVFQSSGVTLKTAVSGAETRSFFAMRWVAAA